jgi:hypothetical protein
LVDRQNDKSLETHTHTKSRNWGSNPDHGVWPNNFDIFANWVTL